MTKLAPTLPILLMATALAPTVAKADCSAPTVSISSPASGAMFEGPIAEIDVGVTVTPQGFDAALSRVYVLVDNQEAASLDVMTGGTYMLTIEVDAGVHELVAAAFDSCGGDGSSSPISITVSETGSPGGASEDEAGNEGSGAATTSNGGDGTGGTDDDDTTTGSTCAVQGSPARAWGGPAALLLALLGIRRLRR